MTRTGKIARLPRDIREQLNRRLHDGQPGKKLAAWLNSLPEVKAVVKREFNNQPIRPQNLSEWKAGGYRDWLDQLETEEFAAHLADEAYELNAAAGLLQTDKVAIWLAARLMAMVRRLVAANTDDAVRWKLLGEAAATFAALRRGDHSAERLKIERELLELDRERVDLDRERVVIESARSIDAVVDMVLSPVLKDPSLAKPLEMLCNAIIDNTPEEAKSHVPLSQRKPHLVCKVADVIRHANPTESNQIKPISFYS